jgi:hypothetical protein
MKGFANAPLPDMLVMISMPFESAQVWSRGSANSMPLSIQALKSVLKDG